jgi:hypothetical protein
VAVAVVGMLTSIQWKWKLVSEGWQLMPMKGQSMKYRLRSAVSSNVQSRKAF